jgi:hypothetical protein
MNLQTTTNRALFIPDFLQRAKTGSCIGVWVAGSAGTILGFLVALFFVAIPSFGGANVPLSIGMIVFIFLFCVSCLGLVGMALGATVGWLIGCSLTMIGIVVLPKRNSEF